MVDRFYVAPPDVGDLVMFTDKILDLLKANGDLYFNRYRGHPLRIVDVTRNPFIECVTIGFISVPLNLKDIINLALDGTIGSPSSETIRNTLVFQSSAPIAEPRNNDGRIMCFWCGVPTQKRGGGRYDVCPKCGR